MKVLLVNGSPHEKGCTYTALSHMAAALEQHDVETKIYWIGNKAIHGCMDCGKCAELHQCVLQDNVNEFRELAQAYDGYVFGTPVYYAGMNGSMKAFMDRVFFSDLWGRQNTFAFKPAASVITARRAGTTAAYDQINKYFAHSQMPIISSTYWNLAYGMNPEQIETDAEGIYTMENLGRSMAYFLKCMEAGKMQEEMSENARPEIVGTVENMADYDTVFIGFPNWWGDMPMIVYNFIESYDFAGKTVILFCTHGGSGLSRTESTIEEITGAAMLDEFAISGKQRRTTVIGQGTK